MAVCRSSSSSSPRVRRRRVSFSWAVFSGDLERAQDYKRGMELLAALRLCSNVPGQWAVQTALGGYQSIHDLVRPGGRLHLQRETIIERVAASPYRSVHPPRGSMYAFIKLDDRFAGSLDDQSFALELLESMHVLVAPGSSFNTAYTDHFRITTLPNREQLHNVFDRIDSLLAQHQ